MPDQFSRLLIAPKPYPDESFMGYILRLTDENGYEFPSWILGMAGYKNAGPLLHKGAIVLATQERADLEKLSKITGAEIALLERLTYPRCTSNLEVFGQELPQYAIRLDVVKVCPACLAESGYIRKAWEIAPVTACPIHGHLLISRCPKCNSELTWRRSRVCYCSCGYDIREMAGLAVPELEQRIGKQIYHLCGILPGHLSSPAEATNPLLDLDLSHFSTSLFLISGQLNGASGYTGKKLMSVVAADDLHPLLCRAYAVFERWPDSYYAFLDWRRQQDNKTGYLSGRRKDFGSFYDLLYKEMLDPGYDYLRREFEIFLATRWDGGYVNVRKNRLSEAVTATQRPYINKLEAAHQLAVSSDAIDSFLARGLLVGSVQQLGKKFLYLIDEQSVLRLKDQLDKALGLVEAAELLRVDIPTVTALAEQDCIVPLRGKPVDGSHFWKIQAETIEHLYEELCSRIRPIQEGDTSVGFLTAIKMLTCIGISAGQFVKTVLDGHLSPCAKAETDGLAQFQFSKRQIQEFLSEKLQLKKGNVLTIADASKALGISRKSLDEIVEKGMISTCAISGMQGTYIAKDAIEAFNARYVFPATLARQAKTSPRYFCQQLMAKGIMPVIGPQIDGSRQYVIERKDIACLQIDELKKPTV